MGLQSRLQTGLQWLKLVKATRVENIPLTSTFHYTGQSAETEFVHVHITML